MTALLQIERAVDVYTRLEAKVDPALRETYDLTFHGYRVLNFVQREPGLTMTRLGELLGRACSTMTDLIDRLERKGWIERVRSTKDRRAIEVYLVTPERFAKAEETVQTCMAEVATELAQEVA